MKTLLAIMLLVATFSSCGTEIGNGWIPGGGETFSGGSGKRKSGSQAPVQSKADSGPGNGDEAGSGSSSTVAAGQAQMPNSPVGSATSEGSESPAEAVDASPTAADVAQGIMPPSFDLQALFTSCATPFATKHLFGPIKLAEVLTQQERKNPLITAEFEGDAWVIRTVSSEPKVLAVVRRDTDAGPNRARIFDANGQPLADHFRCTGTTESNVTLDGFPESVHRVAVTLTRDDQPYATLVWYLRGTQLIRVELQQRVDMDLENSVVLPE